jgi:glucose/arabinose dehydrogenase
MKRFKIISIALLLISLGSCREIDSSIEQSKTSNPTIITKTLQPEPIRVSIDKLHQPYATNSASQSPQVIPIPQQPTLNVPKGFKVNVFASNIDRPRWLALTPDGDVLLSQSRNDRILLLKDTNKDGVADNSQVFADASNGLDLPFGMAFTPGYFYVGNQSKLIRYNYQPSQSKITEKGEKIADLPGGGYRQHWTRNVVVSPDNQKLYVSIGSRSNADVEPLPRAAVQVMNLDGSQAQTFAFGLRNPVGLDFHPITNRLYTTVNERDGLGDDLVPDYFTGLESGEFYGWPYAYFKPDLLDPRQVRNGKSINPELVARTQVPDILFQAHSAALGLQFYTGKTFPTKYHNGAFVAFRGSWNRSQGTGYKIVFVPFDRTNKPLGYYEDFITGFLIDPTRPTTWGRPVGLLVLPDGSLLVTEEANGCIYRIQYMQNH